MTVLRLTEKEELKIRTRKGYRTAPATLRKLAASPMILELDKVRVGDWDRFQIRKIGFAVQREMCRKFKGESVRIRTHAVKSIGRLLDIEQSSLNKVEVEVFDDFAVVLSLVPDLSIWGSEEKEDLVRIIRA